LMPSEISVFHTIADIRPQSGGTSRVVVDLADALGKQASIKPVLVTQSLVGDPTLPSLNPVVQRAIADTFSMDAYKFGLPFHSVLQKTVTDPVTSLIHNHGLWMPVNHWASRFARKHGVALIIQPHGMLEPWAIDHKAWKKRVAMVLFQRGDLMSAKALIATSFTEYENIRKIGFRQPVAVIPNGVALEVSTGTDSLPSQHADENRTVLFLSRIHQKKGLESLVRAWARIRPQGWRLCIAGPDEGGYLKKIMALVGELGIEKAVEYVGPVDGAQKSARYRDADLFVLPTFSENFGVVVAEAMAHGVPVITTRGAPWSDLITNGCGWWVDIGVDPLEQALRDAMSLSDDERGMMGARGREYVRRFDWDTIAQQTTQVYRWVLDQGDKPECVITD
jgi:glycosyltransferase involved in cell wall biosynthesis